MPLKCVSLFSGAGGFCEGFRLAGCKLLCAVEADVQARMTHSANFKEVPLFRDKIERFLTEEHVGTPGLEELAEEEIDVVYGGPPCQGFSQIGTRKLSDPRNRLYEEFARVVGLLAPRVFVMENVPNMVAMHGGHYKSLVVQAFGRSGYNRVALVSALASEFGVPQKRRRVFFVGLRDSLPFPGDFETAAADFIESQKTSHTVTVWEALSDLPAEISEDDAPLPYPRKPSGRYSEYQKLMRLDWDAPLLAADQKRGTMEVAELHNHHTKGMRERRKRIVARIRPGGSGDSLPTELWNGVRGHKWRRLHPDRPSYTILAQMHRDLSEWIHPRHDRWITVREAARLQSFHDGFVFLGSECQQLKQVGNAVPPLMGLAVARAVTRLLEASVREEAPDGCSVARGT